MVVNVRQATAGKCTITLQNSKDEAVSIIYDVQLATLCVDRTKSGDSTFNNAFSAVTTAPIHGKLTTLHIFVDKSSIEVLDNEGRVSITNTIFPSDPYSLLNINNTKGCKISATVYKIK